jgi:hypothetical protein
VACAGVTPGRALWCHLVPFGTPAHIEPDEGEAFIETFARCSVLMPPGPRPGFWFWHQAHGGVRVGEVVTLINTPAWCDMVALVDDTPAGDALLSDIDDDGGRLPLSIEFKTLPSGTIRYHGYRVPEVRRTRVWLRAVAIVDKAAYEGARLYARGHLTNLAATSK